jgi:2-dehydropantoate 2-reductase
MRIAIMAAGSIGGYLGARLVAGGCDVSFIARGAHLETMKNKGLQIESTLGDLHLNDITVTDNPAEIGPVDIVIFTVKLWDNETAAEMCKPLISDETAVITFQNGIESIDMLSKLSENRMPSEGPPIFQRQSQRRGKYAMSETLQNLSLANQIAHHPIG